MKVSYEEDLANRFGLDRKGVLGNWFVLSVRDKGNAGQVLSSEITLSVCRSCPDLEKATPQLSYWQDTCGRGGVCDPVHVWTSQSREPGGPVGFHPHANANVQGIGGTVRKRFRRKV